MTKAKDLTHEQLTVIASKEGKVITTLVDDKSNVKEFLREYGVKDGSALIPNYKVYYDYCRKWKPTGRKLSKIGFLRKFSVVFESKRNEDTRYYLLTEEVFDTSEEAINEAKQFDRRYRNKIKKKNEQKKQGSVPSVAEEVQPKDETGLH